MAIGTDGTIGKDPNSSTSQVIITPDIDGGTIDNTPIGGTTPAAGTFSPVKSKGPAAITTFAGTVSTAGASTTVTWSSAADAILAGYDATNPTLGTTIITGAIKQASVTRYVVSWTNATACVVDVACTLAAATELTSVQLPITTFVNSAGVGSGVWNAAGNVGIGTTTPSEKLDVAGNIRIGSAGYLKSSGGDIYFAPFSYTMAMFDNSNAMSFRIYNGVIEAIKLNSNDVSWFNSGNVGIGTNAPSEKLDVVGNIKFAGTTGGFVRKIAEATSGALSGATGSIAVNVPTSSRILGVQLRVDTAITSDNATKTWAATYVNTPTTAITSGQIFDANTKFNAIHPAYEITTGTVTITITAAAGLFTGGVVRGIVYYEALDAMASL